MKVYVCYIFERDYDGEYTFSISHITKSLDEALDWMEAGPNNDYEEVEF